MNNRQANNNGRRRGRGGQQRQGGSTNQGNGNRIDNRARGNAAQLLEKYKNLASDAQRQGDRVNAEYYLQFADHYFRVLSETRSRFEEQNPNQRQARPSNEFDGDEDDFDMEADGQRSYEPREERQPRDDRQARDDRPMRDDRPQREDRQPREERQAREDRPQREERQPREERQQREPREARDDREPRAPREPRQYRDRDDRRPVNGSSVNGATNGPANDAGDLHANGNVAPARTPAAVEANGEEAPAPRRRGRPRRDEVQAEAPASIDAAVLPPAFGIEASAEAPADEEAPKKPRRRRVAKSDDAEAAA